MLDLAAHGSPTGSGGAHGLPPQVGRQVAAISLAPVGSSSGGRVSIAGAR